MSGPAPEVGIFTLSDSGDLRGSSFPVPVAWARFLPSTVDLHATTLRPGHVRGNHYHRNRREVIIVIHRSGWTLHWDRGPGTDAEARVFHGPGAVLLTVDPGAAHAIENSGAEELVTLGITDGVYDPADTVRKELIAPQGG